LTGTYPGIGGDGDRAELVQRRLAAAPTGPQKSPKSLRSLRLIGRNPRLTPSVMLPDDRGCCRRGKTYDFEAVESHPDLAAVYRGEVEGLEAPPDNVYHRDEAKELIRSLS
jgi:hypothetical protein